MRSLDNMPLWRLVLLNVGVRCLEIAERGHLFGESLVTRIRQRWQAPQRQGDR